VTLRILDGVVRPMTYTGNAMHNFAYAHRVLPQPGRVMPNAFIIPLSKTPTWWAKDWMERHTYFLPRYETPVGWRARDTRSRPRPESRACSAGPTSTSWSRRPRTPTTS
jgi:hypothetical protein